jgi:cell division protein ZapA
MAIVEVKIGSREYQLSCEDGQEQHLIDLSEGINSKVNMLSQQMRTNNEPLLLLMSALMTQDELNESKKAAVNSSKSASVVDDSAKEEEIAEILNSISSYLDSLTEKLFKI